MKDKKYFTLEEFNNNVNEKELESIISPEKVLVSPSLIKTINKFGSLISITKNDRKPNGSILFKYKNGSIEIVDDKVEIWSGD
jgi:CRISPR/Cas system-associated endonuclease Cas1